MSARDINDQINYKKNKLLNIFESPGRTYKFNIQCTSTFNSYFFICYHEIVKRYIRKDLLLYS
jgi:hypothetical protein